MFIKKTSGQIGSEAEKIAEKYLQQQGLKLVTRNFRCFRGEIDLIMREEQVLVFIEVRSRNNAKFGSAVESVNTSKKIKILKTAQFYLQQKRLWDKISCRFDLIAFGNNFSEVTWLKDIFN